jgi:hypothetical protein
MPNQPFDESVLRKFRSIRAMAESGTGNEQANAARLLAKMERDHPGIRAHVNREDQAERARKAAEAAGFGGQQPPNWSAAAGAAADFLKDILNEAAKQKKRNPAPQPVEEEDDEDEEADGIDLFEVTSSVTKAGKVTVKVTIDAEAIDELLETYEDDEEGLWNVFHSVGATVAAEIGEVILDESDEDDD